jgi:hypothetical protein
MNLNNRSFTNNQTGEVVKIIDTYQNIAITDKKEKIDSNRLMDTKFYTEYIDPKSFFQSTETYNVFADKIRSVDLSKIPDDNSSSSFDAPSINMPSVDGFNPLTNESAVVAYDPEDEKAELMRKYGATMNTDAISKQNQAFSKILGEDEEVMRIDADTKPVVYPQSVVQQPNVQPYIEYQESKKIEDPIIMMFRNAKRIVEFSVDLKVDGKIPRLDFIEMMEDSYETSIIDFLAQEFTNDLLINPDKLKELIVKEIRNKVYPKTKKKEIITSKQEEGMDVIKTKAKRVVKNPKQL